MLELKDAYLERGGKAILRGASVFLPEGENLCVYGPPASGKSSVLLAMQGLLPLRSGYITIDGEAVNRLSAPYFRREMSLVAADCAGEYDSVRQMLQDVFHLRVNRNVEEPMKAIKGELALLEMTADVLDEYPCGLSAETLQRVMLAAAGVLKRRFLLFDNMTGLWAMEYIRGLNRQGLSAVITTGDEATAGVFEKTISL